MATPKVRVPLGLPAEQNQSRLFLLPAEIRTYIYELTLLVEPDADGDVFIAHDLIRPANLRTKSSVLALLATCRQVYQEAGGIFLHQNKICVPHRALYPKSSNFKASGFLDITNQPRLDSLRHLKVFVSGATKKVNYFPKWEVLTVVCKSLRKARALESLTFVLGSGYRGRLWVKHVQQEMVFLGRALKKLVSVTELCFYLPDDLKGTYRETVRTELEKVAEKLPKSEAKVCVL
ncbi:hypothetical protein PRZ48_004430 [Zasmidium cellare]|uniref:Uncharacterized protein n=1 Tax=Zasmidium cellare TaxID=395010 RepID=A0ABR0EQJ0_ZASCE|nr:hypothetical protein PRZ48_004430 [Zasmidium cellare]